MAYEPTEWKKGDVVTSAKLNKLEEGVAAAGVTPFIVEWDGESGTQTVQTCQDTFDAFKAGRVVLFKDLNGSEGSEGYVAFTSINKYVSDDVTNWDAQCYSTSFVGLDGHWTYAD